MSPSNAAEQLCKIAKEVAEKGWLPATSGNLSILLARDPLEIAITRSGADKQYLKPEDVLRVDQEGQVLGETPFRPSAETVVHTELYRTLPCGSILHVHTMFNNLASELYFEQGAVPLKDHELLKALDHWEEDAAISVPIVENFHNLEQLGAAVRDAAKDGVPGVLVRNHGIYAWGDTAEAAKRHLEAFEFLFEYHIRIQVLKSHPVFA